MEDRASPESPLNDRSPSSYSLAWLDLQIPHVNSWVLCFLAWLFPLCKISSRFPQGLTFEQKALVLDCLVLHFVKLSGSFAPSQDAAGAVNA
jgi:hypothetical protein